MVMLGARPRRGGVFLLAAAGVVLAGGCTSSADAPRDDEIGSTEWVGGSTKGLTDPRGPDLGIDADRLRASVRVTANASVTPAEVEEGCAARATGRTLVRFDVKSPNFGPGDLHFGTLSCRSTSASPGCSGVECRDNPSCCCNGQNRCTASGGDFGDSFEFACAHRHIHFKSFASYRLVGQNGVVAAAGHKQSFCLMDIEGAAGSTCGAPRRFGCVDQGIHAGCADVYSSDLPCSFVDATGLPEGDYTLEVTIDPHDAINESNESNNIGTAQVRIGTPPPPPPPPLGVPVFLVRDGAGSEAEARAYYASIAPELTPGVSSLADWKARFVGATSVATAFYRNKNELGFWREMTCTQAVGRGVGGCSVTNWDDPGDRDAGFPNRGTVAMNLDARGNTRFYAFLPDGKLTPSAVLDNEGPKFLPQLCTVCHGGEYRGNGDANLGSLWREFEPSQLQPPPGATAAQVEAEVFALNQIIRAANQAVRSEAEGAPFLTDRVKGNAAAYLGAMYAQTVPPISRSVRDPFHIPSSWQTGATAAERDAKARLWTQLVNPSCMTCHRSNTVDFADYARFQALTALQDGRPVLRRYIEVDSADPNRTRLPFMPQSKLTFETLRNDADALLAVERWLQEATNRPPLADAGPATRAATAGATVSLSAAASSDPDGDPLTFVWEVVSGPAVSFAPSTTARDVTFVAPAVTATTDVVIRLRVRDSRMAEDADPVAVTVSPAPTNRLVVAATDVPKSIPDNNTTGTTSAIAVAGAQTIADLKVSVDIGHTWIGDLRVVLSGPGALVKTLHDRTGRDADDIRQTYLVSEAVGRGTAGTWTLRISDLASEDLGTLRGWTLDFGVGSAANRPPLASAGPATRTAASGSTVSLTAAGSSDPDGDPLGFLWEQVSGPAIAFAPSATSRDVTFVAPTVPANTDVVVRLRVRDGRGGEGTAQVAVTVQPPAGSRLTAAATDVPKSIPDNNTIGVTSAVNVAQNSTITDLKVAVDITHTWIGDLRVVLLGPNGFSRTLHDQTGDSADNIRQTFPVPEVVGRSTGGAWQLRVQDVASQDTGALNAWSLDFGVSGTPPVNRPPLADAGPDATVGPGASVTLDAGASGDPDGDVLTFVCT